MGSLKYKLDTDMNKYDFMFGNLPITLNTIIFEGIDNVHDEENVIHHDNCKIIEFLRQKMILKKLSLGCKTYFIDCYNKIHTITE